MRKDLAFYSIMLATGVVYYLSGAENLHLGTQAIAPLVMAAPAIISTIGKLFGNRSAGNAQRDQANRVNDYIRRNDAANAAILRDLQAAGIDLFNPNDTATRNTSQYGSSTQGGFNQRQDTHMRRDVTTRGSELALENRLRNFYENTLDSRPNMDLETIRDAQRRGQRVSRAREAQAGGLFGLGASASAINAATNPFFTQQASEVNNAIEQGRQRVRDYLQGIRGESNQFVNQRLGSDELGTVNTTGSNFSDTTGSSSSMFSDPLRGISLARDLRAPTQPFMTTQTGRSTFGNVLEGAGSALGSYIGAGGTFGRA